MKKLISTWRRTSAETSSLARVGLRILSLLSDAELIRQHEAFHATNVTCCAYGYGAEKNAAAKKPSAFERFSKAALAKA